MLAKSTSGLDPKMSFVPLPWCTSQSSTNTRSRPSASSACRAATATLLKKQNPIATRGPGGGSGRPQPAEPPRRLATDERLDERHRAAGGVERRVVGALARDRVGVERAPAAL